MKEEKSPLLFQTVVSVFIVVICLLLKLLFPNTLQSIKDEYDRLVKEIPVFDLSEINELAFDYDSLSDFKS